LTPQPFTAATLENGWAGTSGDEEPLGYTKDQLGVVRLQGTVFGTAATNGVVFNLPPGDRPSASFPIGLSFLGDCQGTPTNVIIAPDSDVASSCNGLPSFSGITFRAG
jgi:hypothetical protein